MNVIPYRQPAAERPWVNVLQAGAELARAIADTEFVPKALRHNPAAIAAAILYGDEVGLGPMQSLQKIAVIDGSPGLAAETQRALVLAAGHSMWLEEHGKTRVTWAGRRRGEPEVTRVTWSMDTAREAGLAGNRNYRNYPRQMLSARASAELCKAIFADVIAGLPALEEFEDGAVAAEAPAVAGDAPVATAPNSRRRSRPEVGRRIAADRQAGLAAAPEPIDTTADDGTGVVLERPAWRPTEPGEDEPDAGAPVPAPEPPSSGGPGTALPEPETDDVPITDQQLKRLQIAMREAGIGDRSDRLAFASTAAGRQLTSSRQLTKDEASALIELLAMLKPRTGEPTPARRGRRQAPEPESTPDTPPSGASAPPSDPSPGASPSAPSGGGSGSFPDTFPDDLPDLQEQGTQPALPLPEDETAAAWRRVLAQMPLVARRRFEEELGTLIDELRFVRPPGADLAAVLTYNWPLIAPSAEAAALLLEQLGEESR